MSGIETYYYEVFVLGNDGMSLSEDLGIKISETNNIVRTDETVSVVGLQEYPRKHT